MSRATSMTTERDTAAIQLPTGVLVYWGDESNEQQLSELCGVGARNNPKRGFVFVSKVLGKHIPAIPLEMLASHRRLARQISQRGNGTILFIGMAETATGLGHGVFEAYLELFPGAAALFLQTTRYPLSGAQQIEFQEEHSHATRQYLYLPEEPARQELLDKVTTAVIVDDEATSGTTFVNLVVALQRICPHLSDVYPVVLTDFTGGKLADRFAVLRGLGLVQPVSLWQGRAEFHRDVGFESLPVQPAFSDIGCRRAHTSSFTARLGIAVPLRIPETIIEECVRLIGCNPVLVVGTGECMHPAFRLALALEERGHEVLVQSTTRSPLLKAGAIENVLSVPDPYGEDIPNYLYNFSRSAATRVIVVHETRERERISELISILDAIELDLAELKVTSYPRVSHVPDCLC